MFYRYLLLAFLTTQGYLLPAQTLTFKNIGAEKPPFSLDEVQKRHFLFFWELAHPANFQIPDRYPDDPISSIAATGFGLSVYLVGAERRWITRAQAAERVLNTRHDHPANLWHTWEGAYTIVEKVRRVQRPQQLLTVQVETLADLRVHDERLRHVLVAEASGGRRIARVRASDRSRIIVFGRSISVAGPCPAGSTSGISSSASPASFLAAFARSARTVFSSSCRMKPHVAHPCPS